MRRAPPWGRARKGLLVATTIRGEGADFVYHAGELTQALKLHRSSGPLPVANRPRCLRVVFGMGTFYITTNGMGTCYITTNGMGIFYITRALGRGQPEFRTGVTRCEHFAADTCCEVSAMGAFFYCIAQRVFFGVACSQAACSSERFDRMKNDAPGRATACDRRARHAVRGCGPPGTGEHLRG